MSAKISQKELKQPDFFHSKMEMLWSFLSQHRTKAYYTLIVMLLIVAIGTGWYIYRVNYENSALLAYNRIESQLSKSENGKEQNAEEQKKGLDGLKDVIVKYPRSESATFAYYQLGNRYLTLNQTDSAIDAYGNFIKRTDQTNFLLVLAYSGLGYAYEAKKDYEKALTTFQKALKLPSGKIFEAQIYRDMARIYEEMKDTKNSIKYYKESLAKTTDATMEIIIKRTIASLS